ncbi:MAG TPA: nucleotidyltransferase family protein [Nocardioides sp.]|nr:nucleotidyltransferase family protein [Nocardioides sp.]
MDDVRRISAVLAAHGLEGAPAALPREPLEDSQWNQLRATLRFQRLSGPAVAAADAGELVLTDAQRQELEEEHLQALGHVLRLERILLRVDDLLGEAAVPFAVLKGSAVAHLDYADPSLRAFGDDDILIPTEHFAAAVQALLRAGYRRPAREVRPGFDVRFGKGATLVGEDRYELDVHRTFAMGPFGLLVDMAELWDGLDRFELGGRQLSALGPEQRFLHACYHAVIGNPKRRLVPYRDVAEMTLYGSHDLGRLRELAEHWGAGAVLARALVDTWEELGLTSERPLLSWARGRVASGREQRLLRVYTAGTSYAAQSAASLVVLPRWRDRVALVRMLAFPGAAYTSTHGRSPVGWLLRGARRALRVRGESPGSPRG